jgi:hypothetical protein
LYEADDDKYVSIGFGRFKLKGKEDDDDADVYVKTDSGKYEKSADQSSDDKDAKDDNKPSPKKAMSIDKSGGFDASDEPDTGDIPSAGYDDDRDAGRQADFDREYGDDEKNASEKENEKIEDELHGIAKDKGLTVGSEDANHGGEIHGLVGKDDDADNVLGFHAAPKFDDDGNMTDEVQYAIELGMGSSPIYFDSKEEAEAALKKIVDDQTVRDSMDGESDPPGVYLSDLEDHVKNVLKSDDDESKPIPAAPMETKVINGKKYRAIKEGKNSKKPKLQETYERIANRMVT